MSDLFSNLSDTIDAFSKREQVFDPYFFWEPFDIAIPSSDVIAKALEDGVDLLGDEVAELAGPYPRRFQSGMVLSTKPVGCIQASSQTGKSITNEIILGSSISRQPPYCLRYDEGEDTGIQRMITPINVMRYGRIDSRTGSLIDYDPGAIIDLKSWNCGNITGVGKFPEELYCPDGKQLWVGTLARSVDTFWWKALAGIGSERFLPVEFLDQSRGNHGTNRQQLSIYCPRDITIFIKSYDSERQAFESQGCHILFWDEEPPKPELYSSGSSRATYQRFSFTPLEGRTWSEGLFFGCVSEKARNRALENGIGYLKKDEFDYFQATQYDSPYREPVQRDRTRRTLSVWERKAIVWGRYSEHEGMAFFDRSKIQQWMRKFSHNYKSVKFEARSRYHGVTGSVLANLPGILNVKIDREDAEENMQDTWRIYEPPIKGVGYLALFDAAEGAVDPSQVQDKSFGMIVRGPLPGEDIIHEFHPVIVATTRSTLPTIAFARSSLLPLRYYNNALLAAERGHGKDNEAFGITLDDWPYWYYYQSMNDTTKRLHSKKGFDTNTKTRTAMFDMIQDWVREFTVEEDPKIRDSWVYDELAGAVVKETQGGKRRCDHTRDGSLDGVICLGIATYIYQKSPELIVCNDVEEENLRVGFMQRLNWKAPETRPITALGAGASKLGGR